MSESKVLIRSAQCNDVGTIVEIHMAAFERFFLTFLGAKFLDAFYQALIKDELSISFVVEVDNQVAGFALGSSASQGLHKRLLRRCWLRMGIAAMPALIRRPSSLARIISNLRAPTGGIQSDGEASSRALLMSLAVSPGEHRGGLGQMLVEQFCLSAQTAGAEAVELTTDA